MSLDYSEIINAAGRDLGNQKEYFSGAVLRYRQDLAHIDNLHRGGRLLEIGGFPFLFSICLKGLGIDVCTVDLAPDRARTRIRKNGLNVVACDIERERLPFEDGAFHTIAFCETFEHLRMDPVFALEEMRRVLHSDGALYLTTPNLYRLGNILSFLSGRGLAFDPIVEYRKLRGVGHMGHVREYTKSEVSRFLTLAGFAAPVITTRAWRSRRGRLVDVVHQLLPPIRSQLVVTARAVIRRELPLT